MDGEMKIGQSIAMAQYVGRKFGFSEGLDADKALQYMLDLEDLNTEFGKAKAAGMGEFKKFLDTDPCGDRVSGRFGMWLSNIERSIAGPFYFGAKPTYVDFQMMSMFGMMKGRGIDKLQAAGKVGDLLAAYPKVI